MTMLSELKSWINSHYSDMRQEYKPPEFREDSGGGVCERFPSKSRGLMIVASEHSAAHLKEVGMPIKEDFALGEPVKGTRWRVAIPRPKGTIGTFHTHPHRFPEPSGTDMLEALNKDDKVTCIGATGYTGTKIACYEPKSPDWEKYRSKVWKLGEDMGVFNEYLRATYVDDDGKPLRGSELREAMKGNDPWKRFELERRRNRLVRELVGAFPMQDCKLMWETLETTKEFPEWFYRTLKQWEEL